MVTTGMGEDMGDITIRDAVASDAATLVAMVRELAEYEREGPKARATVEDFLRDGFGPTPRFEAIIAEQAGLPIGFALFYSNYSTWDGRPSLFVEDLFVRESARKSGLGRRLIARLAAIATERGWSRMFLNVLDWNPARGFYHRIGFAQRQEWLLYHLTGDKLAELAAEAVTPPPPGR
jgi:GNAT superfamily N-acetyltransferase